MVRPAPGEHLIQLTRPGLARSTGSSFPGACRVRHEVPERTQSDFECLRKSRDRVQVEARNRGRIALYQRVVTTFLRV
jgi:hypothetical protein